MAVGSKSAFVIDVNEQSFTKDVLEKSRQTPVVVDFWAEWCGPCKALSPTLERLAAEFNGAFILAKINTEDNQQLAAYFRIQSIPNVKMIVNAKIVDEFVGVISEDQIREFLSRHIQSPIDKQLAEAQRMAESGDKEAARSIYELVLNDDPDNSVANLELARLLIADGDEQAAESHLERISIAASEYDTAVQLRQAMSFHRDCRAAGGEDACRRKVEANPNDLDARFGLASCLAAARKYEEALNEFLAIVAKDKTYQDEAARKAMIALFSVIGERSDLANEYRRKLASVLY
ncbi:MAG TPA: co-chaperone YbbN [Blastocatellia bacterium]|nr:co-chaperone YbbN [Blastocatellia bacterium]